MKLITIVKRKLYIRAFNYSLEAAFSARWPWSHFKVHKRLWYTHVVWGKLSLIYGQPHLEPIQICLECNSGGEIRGVWAGDEGWSICTECETIEPRTEYITLEEYEAKFG